MGLGRFCGNETPIFHCARGEVLEVKGPSDAALDTGSGVTGHVWWLTLGAAQLGGCTGVSDSLASDAGLTLFSVRCLLM
jgi:hypothetical protein